MTPTVAQEFGMSQADPAMSGSQQPPQASSTVHILSLLLRLRQCCCHLSLLKKVSTKWQTMTTKKKPKRLADGAHKPWLCSISVSVSAQTLDSSELEGDGIVLSLEEQLNALSLTSSPSTSGPDPKATVALNGTRFPSHLFEDTSESSKVSNCYVYCPKISVKLLVLGWMMISVASTEVSTGYTGVLSLFIAKV